MDIVIKDYPVSVRIGYYPEEQKETQEIIVSIRAELADASSAGKRDELALTVDYARIFALTKEVLQARSFNLVEAVVWHLGDSLLKGFPTLRSVHVDVVKQNIPYIDTEGARISLCHTFKRT